MNSTRCKKEQYLINSNDFSLGSIEGLLGDVNDDSINDILKEMKDFGYFNETLNIKFNSKCKEKINDISIEDITIDNTYIFFTQKES